jgi:hypothetical protein
MAGAYATLCSQPSVCVIPQRRHFGILRATILEHTQRTTDRHSRRPFTLRLEITTKELGLIYLSGSTVTFIQLFAWATIASDLRNSAYDSGSYDAC